MMMKLFKKLLIVAALLHTCNLTFAQGYKEITRRIDSLADIGLPKSALVEVNKLDRLARNNNVPVICGRKCIGTYY
jgi:hypothetical protein